MENKIFYKDNNGKYYFDFKALKTKLGILVGWPLEYFLEYLDQDSLSEKKAERLNNLSIFLNVLAVALWIVYYFFLFGNIALAFIATLILFIGTLCERPYLKYRYIEHGSLKYWFYKINLPIIGIITLMYVVGFIALML